MGYSERADRLRFNVKTQVVESMGNKSYYGMSYDISKTGFSAFLRCKEDFVISELLTNAFVLINFSKMEKLFFDKVFTVIFNLDISIKPLNVRAVRVENSWLRGFEVFIACKFVDIDEETARIIDEYVHRNLPKPLEIKASTQGESLLCNIGAEGGDTFVFQFPGRYLYVPIARDICERLAREVGLSELDCFKIKVATDELYTNAFKHGCQGSGQNIITLKITLDRKGIVVRVRDEAGIPFNYKRYHDFDPVKEKSYDSGLALVDRFTDGWTVNTRPGEWTEVSFYKIRTCQDEGKQ